jgi:hypothetical protein
MARAVHRLHCPLLTLNLKAKHGVLVVQGVTRFMPQVQVVNVWSDNFVISALPIVTPDEINQLVVDTSTMGQPKCATRGKIVKHDERLLVRNAAMVTFLRL